MPTRMTYREDLICEACNGPQLVQPQPIPEKPGFFLCAECGEELIPTVLTTTRWIRKDIPSALSDQTE